MNRKTFLKSSAIIGAGLFFESCQSPANDSPKKLALGFDNFSIRAWNWDADQLLDYAAKQKLDTVLFSDLDVYKSHNPAYLKDLAKKAQSLGIKIQAGTGGICGSVKNYNDKWGTDIEHLKLAIKIANLVGSDVARCYMGSAELRREPKGLEPHMGRVVTVCKTVESYAKDHGIKIAIENHAGDMAAYQLKDLIERAGPDYVGATIDPGNAAFTLEDPIENLKILGPYVLSSGIRDTAIFKNDTGGITANWCKMGEGSVDWTQYFELWRKLCPDAPVQLEIISTWGKTIAPKTDEAFWKNYQDIRDVDYKAFEKLATQWKKAPLHLHKDRHSKEFMLTDLENSLDYCKNTLKLGLK
ncbi:hypothetical protein LNTAR_05659 [Lentisphaera araneosa HTCC2155]|uniref:Xylose isomerase-like TIM barrel domain-containing protein n=1 Tax=Lentisphaera araneosa HTCC2155 TaxID=313628 RepID=A6DPE0_9BACT|nr:sugar phosphate isomerase/epimerase [Lentisphaera araneosa]EDM26436.1 hypothetical protein LNTAR_05659 [Lentisphaera araneosa HTCC2155]